MEQDESDRYRTLDPDDRDAFRMHLAINHLADKSARDIIDRMNQQVQRQTGLRIIPLRHKEYTLELITSMSQILSATICRFNVSSGRGDNREWEVGHKSRYDDPDTKISSTIMSM